MCIKRKNKAWKAFMQSCLLHFSMHLFILEHYYAKTRVQADTQYQVMQNTGNKNFGCPSIHIQLDSHLTVVSAWLEMTEPNSETNFFFQNVKRSKITRILNNVHSFKWTENSPADSSDSTVNIMLIKMIFKI